MSHEQTFKIKANILTFQAHVRKNHTLISDPYQILSSIIYLFSSVRLNCYEGLRLFKIDTFSITSGVILTHSTFILELMTCQPNNFLLHVFVACLENIVGKEESE